MTTDNKAPDCSGCKWAKWLWNGIPDCENPRVAEIFSGNARKEGGTCGPSAKYYEQKEQQP